MKKIIHDKLFFKQFRIKIDENNSIKNLVKLKKKIRGHMS